MMKKSIFMSVILTLLLCLSFSVTAFAETTQSFEELTPTDDVSATDATVYTDVPVDTDAATEPYAPNEPVDTSAVDTTPTDYSEPVTEEATAPEETAAPVSTSPVTNPPEPTEPDENSTYSDYVSPAPVYTPADQDFEENDWQAIKLDLDAPSNGKGSFEFIQNNNTKGNDSIVGFLIAGLVLIFLSLAGFTFVILYRPYKKKAHAKAGARYTEPADKQTRKSSERNSRENRRTFNPDDYNDGF